jgi:hypothetical protein
MERIPSWVDLVPGIVPDCLPFFAAISTYSAFVSPSQQSSALELIFLARWLRSFYQL